jgi:hypothetical protein
MPVRKLHAAIGFDPNHRNRETPLAFALHHDIHAEVASCDNLLTGMLIAKSLNSERL